MGSKGSRPRRIALGRTRRRLSFERRIRISLWLLLLPAIGLGAVLARSEHVQLETAGPAGLVLLFSWALAVSFIMEQIVRPLQTLANVVSALREDDYSFRARGGRRSDAVGDLALEVNGLATMLQARRSSAIEAMALLERVMSAMQSPVLAFAPDRSLRLINAAAERAFNLKPGTAVGKRAADLRMEYLLRAAHEDLISMEQDRAGPAATRWIVQRSSFRLRGVPHLLLLLSDVSAALREEERVAWQRLIRVMGHEINNSLTPIKSIAGSLRAQTLARQRAGAGEVNRKMDQEVELGERDRGVKDSGDMDRGLAVIENRAESLNRFLQAYSQLAGLPAPRRSHIVLAVLLERVCRVETRLVVEITTGPPVALEGDADQLQQALINLVKNAADAATSVAGEAASRGGPAVAVGWQCLQRDVVIWIRDTGAGIANEANLFVPFYTTKTGGTGIGLVLALQILEAHGGTLRLRNRADAPGCEAEVRLPIF